MTTAVLLVLAVWLGDIAIDGIAGWDGYDFLGGAGIAVGALLVSAALMVRRHDFYGRAQRVPFDMAAAILRKDAQGSQTPTQEAGAGEAQLTVYLAGGMVSGWQDGLKEKVGACKYLDPRSHGFREPSLYSYCDLAWIRQSDVVFAYLEADNPGGAALCLELGFAKALGKTTILVDEKSPTGEQHRKTYAMANAVVDLRAGSLDEGTKVLEKVLENSGT